MTDDIVWPRKNIEIMIYENFNHLPKFFNWMFFSLQSPLSSFIVSFLYAFSCASSTSFLPEKLSVGASPAFSSVGPLCCDASSTGTAAAAAAAWGISCFSSEPSLLAVVVAVALLLEDSVVVCRPIGPSLVVLVVVVAAFADFLFVVSEPVSSGLLVGSSSNTSLSPPSPTEH